ncbi:PAS domain-containing protein [Gaoshiqia sediminis]|uniref:PAS domain S-box protein n=1 Tax=Gaoshiqia sediminis TaxID=2986998 RepID=A0AA41Y6D7_9BACT|nr:PAS domain S-box protein [Gaoshiqia sediminis]MCW0482769.1 PAS domain S-box protein [Gaoshiqia sediminis]
MIYDEKSFLPDMFDSPELHQKIIDALPIPIFYRDVHGIYRSTNKAHESFIGLTKEQIIGKTVFDVQPPEIAEIYARRDQELFDSPGNQIYETKFRLPDGTMRDVVFNKAVIRDDAGKIMGIVGSIFDVTDRKKAERKLEKAQEATVIASAMLHKIRAGVIIVDNEYKVIDSNQGFARLFGEEIEELYETIPGLIGADLKELVPEVVYKMFSSIMVSGENMLERDLKIQSRLLHISVVSIYKNRVVGALIRDMSAPSLVREEIISRAQRVNKQNLETVQKIAFLLGENASLTEELLNSIIESYKYGEDEN